MIITPEELFNLLSKVYEDGNCGYLDLKDSYCQKIVQEFVSGNTEEEKKYQGMPLEILPNYYVGNSSFNEEAMYATSEIDVRDEIGLPRIEQMIRPNPEFNPDFSISPTYWNIQ